MSKVTIKFWHEESKSYQDENDGEGRLVVNSDLSVDQISDRFQWGTDFEPHFYKDGERIA